MSSLGEQMKVNRVVKGIKIPHPCGDPTLPEEGDRDVRRKVIECALEALKTDVKGTTLFEPDVKFTLG